MTQGGVARHWQTKRSQERCPYRKLYFNITLILAHIASRIQNTVNMPDIFDSVLSLEEKYYDEGYNEGLRDGRDTGRIEGRLFGFSTGFTTYLALGELSGRQTVWAARTSEDAPDSIKIKNERVIKNVTQLGEIVEDVEVKNGEEEVGNFQEDLKKAKGKGKVLESMLGEKADTAGESRSGERSDAIEDSVNIPGRS